MYLRIIAAVALSFVFYVGSGQEAYHRLYETTIDDPTGETDTIFYHHCSATTSGDVLTMGTKRVIDSDSNIEDLTVIFSKHDYKGNVTWSKELDFGLDTVQITGLGTIEYNGTKDSILFTIEVDINGEHKQLFGKLDNGGNNLDLRSSGGPQVPASVTGGKLAAFVNMSDLIYTPSMGNSATLSRIGFNADIMWSRNYVFTNSDDELMLNHIMDFTTTEDSTIVLAGFGTGSGDEFLLAELDSNGVQLWSEAYTFEGIDLASIFPMEVAPLSNGNLAVAGFYLNSTFSQSNGFVAIVDTAGTVVMAQKLYNSENSTSVSNLMEGADGTLWISGLYTNEAQDSILYFTSNLNTDGTENWTSVFPDQLGNADINTTSLLNVDATDGATFLGHGFIDDLPVLRAIRYTPAGGALCSLTDTLVIEPLTMTEDTLTSTVVDPGLFFDSLGYELMSFDDFRPPELQVSDLPQYCMDEFVDTFFVASVSSVEEENLSYMWNTGSTNDTLFVSVPPMEMPEFSVTVTVNEDVCFKMCDTVQIERIALPQVEIKQDDSRYCEERIIVLTAEYTPGASGQTFIWSTGEMTKSIEITEIAEYSVTVTDDCGEMDSDNIDVIPPNINPSVIIFEGVCDDGQKYLVANYSGIGQQPQFTWSTSETTDSILVSEAGTYSVTVTDECGGDEATAEIDYSLPEIEVSITESPCSGGQIILQATYQGDDNNTEFVWSTNESGNQISVSEEGTYSVTVTDACGSVATQDFNLEFPEYSLKISANDLNMNYCDEENPDNALVLNVQLTDGFTVVPNATYVWSTGESGSSISVSEDGTYMVTATDGCQTYVDTYVADVKQLPSTGVITYSLLCDDEDSALSRIVFSAETDIPNLEDAVINFFIERLNSAGNYVAINEDSPVPSDTLVLGSYRITLSACTQELDQITIDAEAECGDLFHYPIAFFPGGKDELNQEFGPIPNDTINVMDRVTDVEFKIFNRWGETVFESNDIFDKWDGSHKNEPAPSEVYIWYVTYIYEGEQRTDKGNVTLIR